MLILYLRHRPVLHINCIKRANHRQFEGWIATLQGWREILQFIFNLLVRLINLFVELLKSIG
jgi:hypothetical protein